VGSSTVVSHTEQLAVVDIQEGAGWRYNALINPRKAMFNWLRAMALAYDMYEVLSLKFRYVPDCPTTTAGAIAMFIDYDPTDDNSGVSMSDLMSMAGAVTDSLYKTVVCPFQLSRMHDKNHAYYCASGSTPDKFNDVGRLWVQTRGNAALTAAGRLMADYKIRFKDPESIAPLLSESLNVKPKNGNVATLASQSNDNPFGTPEFVTVSGQAGLASVTEAVKTVASIGNALNVCTNGACFMTPTNHTSLTEHVPQITTLFTDEFDLTHRTFHLAVGVLPVTVDLAAAAGTQAYHVLFHPTTYVHIQALITGTFTAADTSEPQVRIEVNEGWMRYGTSHRWSCTPSSPTVGANNFAGVLSYDVCKTSLPGPSYLMARVYLNTTGTLTGKSTTPEGNKTYPYTQISFEPNRCADVIGY